MEEVFLRGCGSSGARERHLLFNLEDHQRSLLTEVFTTLRRELNGVVEKNKRMKVIGRVLSHFHVESKLALGKTMQFDPYNSKKKMINQGLCVSCCRNPIDWGRSSRRCGECLDKDMERRKRMRRKRNENSNI